MIGMGWCGVGWGGVGEEAGGCWKGGGGEVRRGQYWLSASSFVTAAVRTKACSLNTSLLECRLVS